MQIHSVFFLGGVILLINQPDNLTMTTNLQSVFYPFKITGCVTLQLNADILKVGTFSIVGREISRTAGVGR